MQAFWAKYQVIIMGLVGAIVISLQQFLGQPTVDWAVIGFAALMAAASFAGNNWRGKGVSVLGILGAAGYAFSTTAKAGHIDLNQLILAFVITAGALIAPPVKPASYEQNPIIMQAKKVVTILLLILMCGAAKAQFFGHNPVPYPGGRFSLSADSSALTKNFFKPAINISATFSDGTSAAGGVGVSWQHDKADAASNSYVIQYSFSAIVWLTVDTSKVGGTGGIVVSIPGTAGMVNIGGGRNFTAGKWVAITGVNIPIP
jgi:hypothetical protein